VGSGCGMGGRGSEVCVCVCVSVSVIRRTQAVQLSGPHEVIWYSMCVLILVNTAATSVFKKVYLECVRRSIGRQRTTI
jgi:hypothetical protein